MECLKRVHLVFTCFMGGGGGQVVKQQKAWLPVQLVCVSNGTLVHSTVVGIQSGCSILDPTCQDVCIRAD